MTKSEFGPRKYLYAAHAGALVLVAALAASWFGAPDFFKGLPVGILLGIVAILFRSQLRDEYIERLWNAGTAAAFLTALASTVGLELVRGFADPRVDVFAAPPLLGATTVGVLSLAAFFTAFHLAMWRTRG